MELHRINDVNSCKIPDSEVVKRVLSGEKELYEILMRRHNQTLYRILRGYLKREDEIQDTMQNTYLKSYEKLYQFKYDARFSTWLIRIGINEALSAIKKLNKQAIHNSLQDEVNSYVSELPDEYRLNPESEMMRKEAIQILEDAIDELTPKYRVVYIMSEIEGLSMKEISDCMDISLSNVKVRLHRARGMIKDGLFSRYNTDTLYEFGFNKCDDIVEKVMQSL